MKSVIQTYDLTKVIKGQEVVKNVTMTVKQGEIYGLLGPNGAGKTSLMKMLTQLTHPTGGEIELFGTSLSQNSIDHLRRMSSIIEYPVFYNHLTGHENLTLHCGFMGYHDSKAIDAALKAVNLNAGLDKKVKAYSLGMKQRLAMARAIVTKPELLILDEPINGLDPMGIMAFRALLKQLKEEYGMTILISSHILSEIEHVADTIGIMNEGRLIQEITLAQIKDKQADYLEIHTARANAAAMVLENQLGLKHFTLVSENAIRLYDSAVDRQILLKTLLEHQIPVDKYQVVEGSLESYFMALIQGGKHSA